MVRFFRNLTAVEWLVMAALVFLITTFALDEARAYLSRERGSADAHRRAAAGEYSFRIGGKPRLWFGETSSVFHERCGATLVRSHACCPTTAQWNYDRAYNSTMSAALARRIDGFAFHEAYREADEEGRERWKAHIAQSLQEEPSGRREPVAIVDETRRAYGRENIASKIDSLAFPEVKMQTATEVRNALENAKTAEYAIVFLHVDWAFMDHWREVFHEYYRAYLRDEQVPTISFHYVDVTSVSADYAPLVEINGWDELQNRERRHLMGGNGELAWLKHGTLVEVESIRSFDSPDAFMSRARLLFSTVGE